MPYKDREKQLKYWRDYSKKNHHTEDRKLKNREYARRYYAKNGDKCRAYHRKWYYDNHEHAKNYSKEWHRSHSDDYNAKRRLRRTGATAELYKTMYKQQSGRCAICGATPTSLRVDHNHATGKIRGLLCHTCNYGIGILGDSAKRLRLAATYLEATDGATG